MGTNYYWKDKHENCEYEDDIQVHIGKRSAAGLYCWDCGTTLCKDGVRGIHYSESNWNSLCPSCCKEAVKESLSNSSVGIELGFNKNRLNRSGVSSCSSFTWTLIKHKNELLILAENCIDKVVINEYGEEYTACEFLDLLIDCPIEYQCPREFS